jgi:hypothetical protein
VSVWQFGCAWVFSLFVVCVCVCVCLCMDPVLCCLLSITSVSSFSLISLTSLSSFLSCTRLPFSLLL